MATPPPRVPRSEFPDPLPSPRPLPVRLSPSRAKDYKQCPKLFFYKTILGLRTPPTIHTIRGTLAHSGLEFLFDHAPEERTSDVALEYVLPTWNAMCYPLADKDAVEDDSPEDKVRTSLGAYRHLVKIGSLDEASKQAAAQEYREVIPPGSPLEVELLDSVTNAIENYFTIEDPSRFEPRGRELHLEATTNGVTLHGFIDRLDCLTGSDGEEYWYISDYKGLALTTPLATPTGWTTMGEIQPGDSLYTIDGSICTVVNKSEVHHRPCYEIQFDDGTTIVCDDEHLWEVSASPAGPTQIFDTTMLAQKISKGAAYYVKNTEPLYSASLDLSQEGWQPEDHYSITSNGRVRITDKETVNCVLRGPIAARRDFLQSIIKKTASGSTVERDAECVINTEDAQTGQILQDLVCGLGGTALLSDNAHAVHVAYTPERSGMRTIASITPTKSVATQCVEVSAASAMYLAGRQMVPTHNTGKMPRPQYLDDAFFAMRVYAVLLAANEHVVTHQLRLLYLSATGKSAQKTMRVTSELLRQTEREMGKLWEQITASNEKNSWPTKTGPLCGWCHFQSICPAFEEGLPNNEEIARAPVAVPPPKKRVPPLAQSGDLSQPLAEAEGVDNQAADPFELELPF